jgi:hypothetical protein
MANAAILIGIQYESLVPEAQRRIVESNITDVREVLVNAYGFFPKDITELRDSAATKPAIKRALSDIGAKRSKHGLDTLVVYFCGNSLHVRRTVSETNTYLVPNNASKLITKASHREIEEQCISLQSLVSTLSVLQGMGIQNIMLMLDVPMARLPEQQFAKWNIPVGPEVAERSFSILCASDRVDRLNDGIEERNSTFTKSVVEALKQGAMKRTPLLFSDLRDAVSGKVLRESGRRTGGRKVDRIQALSIGSIANNALTPVMLPPDLVSWNKSTRKVRRAINDFPYLRGYVERMQYCPGGTFLMGSDTDTKDEQPRHEVKLNDFVLGQTPVTWQLWWEYCSATGTPLPLPGALGRPLDHPVVNVSWFDIMGTDGQSGFCGWASDVLGYRVLLPTEAQFEYAALGGESGKAYPWGDRFDRDALWWSGGGRLLENKTAPVYRENKTYKNRFGLIDMAGHCTQWCLD